MTGPSRIHLNVNRYINQPVLHITYNTFERPFFIKAFGHDRVFGRAKPTTRDRVVTKHEQYQTEEKLILLGSYFYSILSLISSTYHSWLVG